MTIVTALLLLEVPAIRSAFALVNRAVNAIAEATQAGTSFVFGYVSGGALAFALTTPGAEFVLAFQALPIVLVMSVLTTLLLAHPAAGGTRLLLGAGADHGRGRRGRPVHRRQYFPRHGGIAAVHPALPRA